MAQTAGQPLQINNTEIEYVQDYKYLGQTVSFTNRTNYEIKTRISNAWKRFWSLKILLKGKMGLRSKMKIFNSSVVPVLTYGAQSWALTQKQLKRVQTTYYSMLRSILGVKLRDKITILDILNTTKSEDIREKIIKIKLNYAGHLARRGNDEWQKIVTEWTPYDRKRKRGRPAKRWRDEIIRLMGIKWTNTAADRDKWRRAVEANTRIRVG